MDYGELVSPLMEFFNQGADKQLGSRKRDAKGNIKMTKWDYVTGRSQEELNTAAQERLNDTGLATKYRRLSGETAVPTDMRSDELETEVNTLTKLDEAQALYRRTRGNKGPGAYEGMDTDEVYDLINQTNVATEESDARKPGGRIERMETSDERYIDAQEASDKRFNATQQLAITQMGIAQQQQANQMQIAQMNNQLQMRRQDSADRRSDRRDRQAMIQQMMAGLSTLGASIAI